MPVAGWPREMWFGNEKLKEQSGKDLETLLRKKIKERKENKVIENKTYNQWKLGRKKPTR